MSHLSREHEGLLDDSEFFHSPGLDETSSAIGDSSQFIRGAVMLLLVAAVSACSSPSLHVQTSDASRERSVLSSRSSSARSVSDISKKKPRNTHAKKRAPVSSRSSREMAEYSELQSFSDAQLASFIKKFEKSLEEHKRSIVQITEELRKLHSYRAHFAELVLSYAGASPAFFLKEEREWRRVWKQKSMAPDADTSEVDDEALRLWRVNKRAKEELEEAVRKIEAMNEKEQLFLAALKKARRNEVLIKRRLQQAQSVLRGRDLDRGVLEALEKEYEGNTVVH